MNHSAHLEGQGSYPRVFLWALVTGHFDSGEVCSMGPHFVYGIYLVYVGGSRFWGPILELASSRGIAITWFYETSKDLRRACT